MSELTLEEANAAVERATRDNEATQILMQIYKELDEPHTHKDIWNLIQQRIKERK